METVRVYRNLIEIYFQRLFTNRDLSAIDEYLAEGYQDSDIPSATEDHVENSKNYIKNLFVRYPTIDVKVGDSIECDNALSVFLEWYSKEEGVRKTLRKGIASFAFTKDHKILNRTTLIYFDAMD